MCSDVVDRSIDAVIVPTNSASPTKVTQVQDEAPLPATVNNIMEEASLSMTICLVELQLTARDILQVIHDLGSKFDLLATNKQVDALNVRVGGMEEVISKRLTILKKCMNASNAQWKAMLFSVGHLTNSLWEHLSSPISEISRNQPTLQLSYYTLFINCNE